jgi:hypothetical protein
VEDGLCQLLLEDNAPDAGALITADKADGKDELTFSFSKQGSESQDPDKQD